MSVALSIRRITLTLEPRSSLSLVVRINASRAVGIRLGQERTKFCLETKSQL